MGTEQTQADYWNGLSGEVWARETDATDPRLEHFGQAGIAALAPRLGERVLDVGCGAGATSRALAQRVGPSGHVTGVDLSRPLLDVARARGGGPHYVQADAAAIAFDTPFDAVFSRFGVMFFEDPAAAFANLRRAAPRGRLTFVCWRSPDENPAMIRPLALTRHLLPQSPAPDPDAPGPFSLADPDRVRRVLHEAGWRDLTVTAHDSEYLLGDTPRAATDYVLTIGPLARAVHEAPETEPSVRRVLETTFTAESRGGAVRAAAATWIVSAVASRTATPA
jgi:SAM-dependent methyltransferase